MIKNMSTFTTITTSTIMFTTTITATMLITITINHIYNDKYE